MIGIDERTPMSIIHALGACLLVGVLVWCAGCASDAGVESNGATRSVTLPPPESARANVALAEQFDLAGQPREAIRHYELAREQDPRECEWVARRLGVLYAGLGDATRAEAEYEKACRLDPNDAVLLNGMGYLCYANGRLIEAEAALRRATEIDPTFGRAWSNLGLTLGAQGRYREAYRAFARAVTPAESRANVALAMAHNGDYAEAEVQMRRAISQQPDLERFDTVLAEIRRERGEQDSGGE